MSPATSSHRICPECRSCALSVKNSDGSLKSTPHTPATHIPAARASRLRDLIRPAQLTTLSANREPSTAIMNLLNHTMNRLLKLLKSDMSTAFLEFGIWILDF